MKNNGFNVQGMKHWLNEQRIGYFILMILIFFLFFHVLQIVQTPVTEHQHHVISMLAGQDRYPNTQRFAQELLRQTEEVSQYQYYHLIFLSDLEPTDRQPLLSGL